MKHRPKQVAKLLKNLNSNNQIKTKDMKARTEKIKVTVRHEEVKEIEVSFPYHVRSKGFYCKFFSRDVAIYISDYSFKKQVEYSNFATPDSWLAFDPITEEEFNAKFNEVMNALIDLNNENAI